MSFGQLDNSGNIVRDPAAPDLPTVPEVYEKIKGKKPSGKFWGDLQGLYAFGIAVQKILWVKADAPAEVLEVFYAAAEQLGKDKDFLTKTDKVLGGLSAVARRSARKNHPTSFPKSMRRPNVSLGEWVGKKYHVKFD